MDFTSHFEETLDLMHSMLPLCQLLLLILATQASCLWPAPAMGANALAGFEKATPQSSRFVTLKISFALSLISKPNSTSSASTQHVASDVWIGIWDTVTSDGIATTLVFVKQGEQITGRTPNVDQSSLFKFRGTLNLAGDEMSFTLTQPASGLTRTGHLRLTTSDTFVGIFDEKDDRGEELTWRGTRRR